jgi:(3R)-3-hydroxyacyl-CoA dehydrogenase / 3a,7a,12a-trihydroxy-5b-cholest-24-enoyl-CoA hydratase / enoyl-CoA hydratase 2
MPELRFEDRVVVITGAGQGLGRAYAEALGRRGAKLVVNDLGGRSDGSGSDAGLAEQVARALKGLGVEAVANTDSVVDGARIVQQAMDTYGRLDVVINNAGVLRDRAFHNMTAEDWDTVLEVHLRGSFAVTRAAWPILRERGYGRVVMTASGAGVYGNFGQANYSAAKLALFGLARSLAIEGAGKNILVNTIAPVAASRLTESVMPPSLLRVLKPEAVMPLVVYLASGQCRETGQLFEVGGGVVSRLRWQRSRGSRLQHDFTPEDLAAAWAAVQDFSASDYPETVADSFAPICQHAGVPFSFGRQ